MEQRAENSIVHKFVVSRSILLLVALAITHSGCATYIDAIFGTQLTFEKEAVEEGVLSEVELGGRYYSRTEVDQVGTTGEKHLRSWTLQGIEARRDPQRWTLDRTGFFVEYLLDSVETGEFTHSEERSHGKDPRSSVVVRNEFLREFVKEGDFRVVEENYLQIDFSYRSDNQFVRLGEKFDVFGGTELHTTCDLFSNLPLSERYQDYWLIYRVGEEEFTFLPTNRIDVPLTGPWSDFEFGLRLNLYLRSHSVSEFLLVSEISKAILSSAATEADENPQLSETIDELLSVRLFANGSEVRLRPEFSMRTTLRAEYHPVPQ